MSCDQFRKFELDQIDEVTFKDHLQSCESCRKQVSEDTRLLSIAKSMKRPIKAPLLWNRIEKSLEAERKNSSFERIIHFDTKYYRVFRIAAVVLIAIGVGYFGGTKISTGNARLLSNSALSRVEKSEQNYIDAIAELEKKVEPRMADLDVEMMLLYRDRLETIDNQIRHCREALLNNPANAHIRRYMLAALQDKKETLIELLHSG